MKSAIIVLVLLSIKSQASLAMDEVNQTIIEEFAERFELTENVVRNLNDQLGNLEDSNADIAQILLRLEEKLLSMEVSSPALSS